MSRYLEIEAEFLEWVKEIGWFVLILAAAIRVMLDEPVSAGFEAGIRIALIGVGCLLIPGACIKLFLWCVRAKNKLC